MSEVAVTRRAPALRRYARSTRNGTGAEFVTEGVLRPQLYRSAIYPRVDIGGLPETSRLPEGFKGLANQVLQQQFDSQD